jgi:hypothetical protein
MIVGMLVIVFFSGMRMGHRHGANAPIISAFYHPGHEKKTIKKRIFFATIQRSQRKARHQFL